MIIDDYLWLFMITDDFFIIIDDYLWLFDYYFLF